MRGAAFVLVLILLLIALMWVSAGWALNLAGQYRELREEMERGQSCPGGGME